MVRDEIKWNEYLLKDGEIAGFSKNVNNNFIKYQAALALKKIGIDPIYNAKKDDSVVWFDEYRNIKNQNSALQEVSNNSYNKGVDQNDILANLDMLRKAGEPK
jgi:ribonucleotide reductase beta subunit family protein with ferritin-like domain